MKFVIKPARRGRMRRNQWRVELVAQNGETLLTSETYNNIGDAQRMCGLVKAFAPEAPILSPEQEPS